MIFLKIYIYLFILERKRGRQRVHEQREGQMEREKGSRLSAEDGA